MSSRISASHNDYHSSEELADDAIHWLREHKRFSPEKPFLIIRPVGHRTVLHQSAKELADKETPGHSNIVPSLDRPAHWQCDTSACG